MWVNACQIWLNSRAPSNSPSPRSKSQTDSSEQTWSKGRSLFVYNLYLKKSKLRTRNSQKKSYGTQRALRLHTTTSCSSIRPRSSCNWTGCGSPKAAARVSPNSSRSRRAATSTSPHSSDERRTKPLLQLLRLRLPSTKAKVALLHILTTTRMSTTKNEVRLLQLAHSCLLLLQLLHRSYESQSLWAISKSAPCLSSYCQLSESR